eukprot:GHVP01008726.1.p1 GENE.GHVP01008726.1~~GHVP01008726.1.p1  ORF type:complete len:236 (-),score=15.65 GHVP01008726.1:395-1102(-)
MYPLAYEAIATTPEVPTPVAKVDIVNKRVDAVLQDSPAPGDFKEKTQELLLEYRDRWETPLEGQCSLAEVDFEVKGDPIACKPIKLQTKAEAEVIREVDKRIARGNLRYDRDCKWMSSVFCVPKKNVQFSMCVNYRKINERISQESFPMSNTQSLFRSQLERKCFSVFDLYFGFNQIRLTEHAYQYTGLHTMGNNRGVVVTKVLPFGFHLAPQKFQSITSFLHHTLWIQILTKYW